MLLSQKKAISVMSKAKRLDNRKPVFIKLEILTVIDLYIFDVLLQTLNNLNYYTLVNSTRGNDNIFIPNVRLKKKQISYKVIGMKTYNKLPKYYYSLPENIFKNHFYHWLLLNPFYSIEEFFSILTNDIIF